MIIILTEIHPLKLKICLEVSKDKGQFRPKKMELILLDLESLCKRFFIQELIQK